MIGDSVFEDDIIVKIKSISWTGPWTFWCKVISISIQVICLTLNFQLFNDHFQQYLSSKKTYSVSPQSSEYKTAYQE